MMNEISVSVGNGQGNYRQNFETICGYLLSGRAVQVYANCRSDKQNNCVQDYYKNLLMDKYGENVQIDCNFYTSLSYHYTYELKNEKECG